jgi:hypothetical protein
MTKYDDVKVKPISELRDAIRRECIEQIGRASKAATAVPAEPKWTYKLRLVRAIIEAAPDLSERQIYSAWKDDRELSRFATIVHNLLCDTRFGRLAGAINQYLNDEATKEEEHRSWIEHRNKI